MQPVEVIDDPRGVDQPTAIGASDLGNLEKAGVSGRLLYLFHRKGNALLRDPFCTKIGFELTRKIGFMAADDSERFLHEFSPVKISDYRKVTACFSEVQA
jgi:hypothetical protein